MKGLFVATLLTLSLILTGFVVGDVADYGFRVAVDRDANDKFIWLDITSGVVTIELDPVTTLPKTYTEAEKPDPNCLSREDLQKWFVSSETDDDLWYKVTFLATDAGLTLPKGSKVLVYGFTYTKDTTATEPFYVPPGASCIQIGGRSPTPGQ